MGCAKTPATPGAPAMVVTARPSLAGIALSGPCATSRLPLSSTALTSGLTLAGTALVCDQVLVAPAWLSVVPCQFRPPSKEISTPATTPPPMSVAVPVTRPEARLSCVIWLTGAAWSVDAEAATKPGMSVSGCTFMSASRLMVACCMSALTPPGDFAGAARGIEPVRPAKRRRREHQCARRVAVLRGFDRHVRPAEVRLVGEGPARRNRGRCLRAGRRSR